MFNYFFGSDSRSLGYLKFLHENTKNLTVVTTEPIKTGRGKKVKANIIEAFCVQNNIEFKYFNQNENYEDMSNALCVSFKNIFSQQFLRMNNNIFNVHLSLLPKFKGPSPVETQILNDEVNIGYSIFKIDEKVDSGPLIFSNKIQHKTDLYASDVYENMFNDFTNSFNEIITNLNTEFKQHNENETFTKKFNKSDFCINNDDVETAHTKIRAFDVIGPAYVIHNDKNIKIHKYTNNNLGLEIKLNDGYIFPSEITPEGRNRMKVEDYIRGVK